MMVADFARVPPLVNDPSVAGDNSKVLAVSGFFVGQTDAGRPQLPRTQEVFT